MQMRTKRNVTRNILRRRGFARRVQSIAYYVMRPHTYRYVAGPPQSPAIARSIELIVSNDRGLTSRGVFHRPLALQRAAGGAF